MQNPPLNVVDQIDRTILDGIAKAFSQVTI
jgi:hypothetical protein